MLKPGKNDIQVDIKFEPEELELLQVNTWQMAESFGLDRRIGNLTGKRKVGFYMWDLECLEMVVDDLRKTENEKHFVEGLYKKNKDAMESLTIKQRENNSKLK